MSGKVYLVLALAAIALAGAQAHLSKYIENPAAGKEGLQESCFVQFTLQEAAERYEGEQVMSEVKKDLFQVIRSMNEQQMLIDRSYNDRYCDKFNTCFRIGAIKRWRDYSGDKWDVLQCHRWAKFDRLCELMRAKNSNDRQKLAIEGWVCQVARENVMELDAITRQLAGDRKECPARIRQEAIYEALTQFEHIYSYTEEQLKEAKQALDEQVAPEKASKVAHDAQVTEEAKKAIKDRIANHLGEFKKCAAKRETDLVEHAKEIAELNERMEQMRGNYLRRHRGF